MRRFNITTAMKIFLLMLVALTLLFSCSDDKDKRKVVKEEYGEPDYTQSYTYAGMKSEIYIFARKDINRTYEFRKTVSGCGGSGKWYIYRWYYTTYYDSTIELYLPPEITHEKVVTAPEGQRLAISAQVLDDEEVVSVTLWYRQAGQEEFFSVRMTSSENNVYTASIPEDFMTGDGVDYLIEAWDEGHATYMPETGSYSVSVTEAAKAVSYGDVESSAFSGERREFEVGLPAGEYSPLSQ